MNQIYKLPLLENRNYLHSTNLFNFLRQKTAAQNNISFKFIQPIYSDCFLLNSVMENAQAIFQYEENAEIKTIAIHEAPQSNALQRDKYDEQAIINQAACNEKTIATTITQDTFFPYAVALIKELHARCLQKEKGRWIFSRADLNHLPSNGKIEITLTKALPVLTCCSIVQENAEIGKIYFSWVEKI